MERIIGHIDMDAFFASVEERDKPYLKGLPVIIGSDPQEGKGRGVVSTANYCARTLGIHSALPISKAWELCEIARKKGRDRCVFMTVGPGRYSDASREVFKEVRALVPVVAQTSIDEAYLDLSFCDSFKNAETLVRKIKRTIQRKNNLTCSIGIGPNRMIAKIASDFNKPNGITIVTPDSLHDFLQPLSVRVIPGIGAKGEQMFKKMGVQTVADLQKYSWEELEDTFGATGFAIWEYARGIDERPVEIEKAKRKSIGKHHTFATDTHDVHEALTVFKSQITSIMQEVHAQGFHSFKTVVITVRFADFTTVTRSLTLQAPISNARELELKTTKLVLPFFEKVENPKGKAVRLIGVRVEKLV